MSLLSPPLFSLHTLPQHCSAPSHHTALLLSSTRLSKSRIRGSHASAHENLVKDKEADDIAQFKGDNGEGNGAIGRETKQVGDRKRDAKAGNERRGLREVKGELRDVHDYMRWAPEMIKPDGAPPRWFCPIDSGQPPQNAPLLLFIPGMDGTGLGLIRHHRTLGQLFEVRCLHIPIMDRTPIEGLIAIVEQTLITESSHVCPRPIYLVGDSLGGAIALAVAARNPNMDLVLVLSNPATSFKQAQLQPLIPLLMLLPSGLYQTVPFLLSFVVGDPVRMTMAAVESNVRPLERIQHLADRLAALLPTLPTLADILPKETVSWKLSLLRSGAMYANSRLHAVKAEVLLLASGKDQMLPSKEEAKRLKSMLSNCTVRYFKDSGHTLLLEEGVDLATIIRGAGAYRRSKNYDIVTDFVSPTEQEFERVYAQNRILRKITSPVFFSTAENGKIVKGLSGVPEENPVLLVGNHMFMGLELSMIIGEFVKQQNRVIRGIAHPVLFVEGTEEQLREPGFFDQVSLFGGVPATKRTFFKVLSQGDSALLYPGGAREALHRKGEVHKLFWPEQAEFIRVAAHFGVTIVPFGAVGEDDFLEILLDYDDLMKIPSTRSKIKEYNRTIPRIRGENADEDLHFPLPLLKLPGRLYILFGKPFKTAGRKDLVQDRSKAQQVYCQLKQEVEACLEYLQERRKEDPYRNFFPRFPLEISKADDWQAPTFDP